MNGDSLVALVSGRFEAFAAGYLADPGEDFAYKLKINHTRRVLGIAEEICAEEKLSAELTLAARLAALMHDVGRFPQFRQYGTFRDAVSANHAGLSVRHALRAGLLADVPAPTLRLVLGAVYLHNMRTLPALRSADLDTVARVIRDSDKLDIYQVMIRHFARGDEEHPEVVLHVKDDPLRYTPAILEKLKRREPGDYRELYYVNDFKLMTIGWIYDLNYRSSCRLLVKRGYIEELFGTLPELPEIAAYRSQVEQDLARRL